MREQHAAEGSVRPTTRGVLSLRGEPQSVPGFRRDSGLRRGPKAFVDRRRPDFVGASIPMSEIAPRRRRAASASNVAAP